MSKEELIITLAKVNYNIKYEGSEHEYIPLLIMRELIKEKLLKDFNYIIEDNDNI